jgi:hypothetical protein
MIQQIKENLLIIKDIEIEILDEHLVLIEMSGDSVFRMGRLDYSRKVLGKDSQ